MTLWIIVAISLPISLLVSEPTNSEGFARTWNCMELERWYTYAQLHPWAPINPITTFVSQVVVWNQCLLALPSKSVILSSKLSTVWYALTCTQRVRSWLFCIIRINYSQLMARKWRVEETSNRGKTYWATHTHTQHGFSGRHPGLLQWKLPYCRWHQFARQQLSHKILVAGSIISVNINLYFRLEER